MLMLRRYLAIALVLLVALTSQQMAMLRGEPKAVAAAVYCLNDVATHTLVDKDGKPVGPTHLCPDCALSLFVDAGTAVQMPVRIEGRALSLAFAENTLPVSTASPTANARGPPLFV